MKSKTLNVYMGYDPREEEAYRVAHKSIWRNTEKPLKIYPLRLPHLGMLTRPLEKRGNQLWCPISEAPMSTEFAISRFCVPFLQEGGLALFVDCDVLCWEDIDNLFALAKPEYAVQVVKHKSSYCTCSWDDSGYHLEDPYCAEHGKGHTKMDGQLQTIYSRKNWSSVVLWNLDHPSNKRFTLENLNTWPGRDMHAFKWLENSEIGELPQKWNWLIGVTPGEPKQEGIWHYTLGVPTMKGCENAPYSREWQQQQINI